MKRLETTILKNLTQNEEYARKVLPFLNDEYFTERSEKLVFQHIKEFILKYNAVPTLEALHININNLSGVKEEEVKSASEVLNAVEQIKEEKSEQQWLIDKTEKFCQEKAIYNAVLESIGILDVNSKSTKDKGAIPKILSDALAVSFDSHVGHDYLADSDARYEFYHRTEKKIPFDLEFMNKITKGGIPAKTLNVFLAGTGVGKSLFMCHVASACLVQGYNVLYITMEMAEEKIAERIDANLLNVTLDDLSNLPKDVYDKKVEKVRKNTVGKLIIKEYPTALASTTHFRTLLNELLLKKSFRPDIIFIDYLNICCSARVKPGSNINSYTYIKAIAEEIRGLAVEFKVPIVSATQTTRSGFSSTDVELTDTSESFGLPATADFMAALISTEELEALNQIMVKQLKNRYNDPTSNKRFVLGIDRAKMRLYDVEQSAQDDILDSGQQKGANDKFVEKVMKSPFSQNKFKTSGLKV
jgi:archaellum biogenesis ATPase FlaH